MEQKKDRKKVGECEDRLCPTHGTLKVRGRTFKGTVKKIIGQRAVVMFERFVYYKKYQRYTRRSTKLHAHIPACLGSSINPGMKVKIGECRPVSKIIHFVVIGVIG